MTDRATARRVLDALQATAVGSSAVLVGSSGLFGFETQVPALTEDIDVSIPEHLVRRCGDEIVRALELQGYGHEPGTATFVAQDGVVFDLLGHGDPAQGDHIGGAGTLRVMVFADISRVIALQRATRDLPEGGQALSPAGFVATKLLTERGAKGAKDKLQALLVIAERATDVAFDEELRTLLGAVERVRRDDARAAALEAFLALGRDPAFADAGAEGYHPWLRDAERGLERLRDLMDGLDA